MINYDDIYLPIANGLEPYTNVTVIQAETGNDQPPYPFYAIKFTTMGDGIGQVSESTEDGFHTIEQDTELVASVTCHADSIESANNLSLKARAYFLGKGHIDLSDKDITVVDVLAVTPRDVFFNIEYERRCGFDLRLRVRGQETFTIDTIEKVTMNE